MGRREQARAEAAFRRGQIGVDGQGTEEKPDQAAVEQSRARDQLLRNKAFLGRELLTWMLYRSESSEPIAEVAGEPLTVHFIDRLVLRGAAGEITEVSVKGASAPYSRLVRMAISQGLLVHTARVRLTHGEQCYETTLDAEQLAVRSAKLPQLMTEGDEERTAERLELSERLWGFIGAMVQEFLKVRAGKRWAREVVPELRAWLDGQD